MTKQFNDQNFDKDVVEASKEKPVLVDFFAEWCGPCKMQGPIIDSLSEEIGDKAIIGKLDVEEAQQIASKYEVMSIPTLLLFKDGEIKEKIVGMRDKDSLKEILEKYL
ncbi:thioredoxin [bacterium]|nr:thioredoxin [bacterium]